MKVEGKNYSDVSKFCVRLISKSVAKEMIIKNHYSHLWTKVSYSIGLFYLDEGEHQFFGGVNEKLVGVACYGDPVGRNSGTSISELLERTEVLELTRLWIEDGYGCNIESWFVSQTFDWLKKNAPHIRALISYSDPKEGHLGTVYQSTNWLYQGNNLRWTDSWSFRWDEDGDWFHSRTSFVRYGTNDPKQIQKVITKPFWIRREPKKHRYFYILDKKNRKKILNSIKHPLQPYPKVSEIIAEEIHKLDPISNEN